MKRETRSFWTRLLIFSINSLGLFFTGLALHFSFLGCELNYAEAAKQI
jgi:hypothetical protein